MVVRSTEGKTPGDVSIFLSRAQARGKWDDSRSKGERADGN